MGERCAVSAVRESRCCARLALTTCGCLQYAQNSQGVLGWGITLLAIGLSQPTNTTTTLPCQNQFGM